MCVDNRRLSNHYITRSVISKGKTQSFQPSIPAPRPTVGSRHGSRKRKPGQPTLHDFFFEQASRSCPQLPPPPLRKWEDGVGRLAGRPYRREMPGFAGHAGNDKWVAEMTRKSRISECVHGPAGISAPLVRRAFAPVVGPGPAERAFPRRWRPASVCLPHRAAKTARRP